MEIPEPIEDSTPNHHKQHQSHKFSVFIALFLLVAIPISYFAVQNIQDLRSRANQMALSGPLTGTEPQPIPVQVAICPDNYLKDAIKKNNCNYVGGAQIQKAVDEAAAGTARTIQFINGEYIIPETKNSYSIVINNKANITFKGDTSPNSLPESVKLKFSRRGGGIRVENSRNISFVKLDINGITTNGVVNVINSENFSMMQSNVQDMGANAIQIANSGYPYLFEMKVRSSAQAVSLNDVRYVVIQSSRITGSSNGVYAARSNGTILRNLIATNSQSGFHLNGGNNTFEFANNTFVSNNVGYKGQAAALYIGQSESGSSYIVNKNIFVSNGKGLFADSQTKSFSANQNLFWSNGQDYGGVPKMGSTIAANPLFGTDYCLNPGSPALLQGDYIGFKGACLNASPTPSIKPTVVITKPVVKTPTPQPTKKGPINLTKTPIKITKAPIRCPAKTTPYFSHCSCDWTCVSKTPKLDCNKQCANE